VPDGEATTGRHRRDEHRIAATDVGRGGDAGWIWPTAPVLLFPQRSHGELNVVYRRGDGKCRLDATPRSSPAAVEMANAARNDR